MKPFSYTRVTDAAAAVDNLSDNTTKFLGGGTNLLDLLKYGVEQADKLVDITPLPLAEISQLPEGGVRIGAMARNSDTANHPLIRQHYPLLSQALLSGATAQLRNMATVGGNLMQRTRCYYFYDPATPCNKREPGSGCPAIEGFNRIHAILGTSENCIATHPSDMCVALAALDAKVQVTTGEQNRTIPLVDFHRLPGETPNIDTNLQPGELITAVDLPPSDLAAHSFYLKVRDRASYAFAIVSVAAALELEGEQIKTARIALGGVAHKPWRAVEAENSLTGKTAGTEAYSAAAEIALESASPYQHNGFKIQLAKNTIVRALTQAAAGGIA